MSRSSTHLESKTRLAVARRLRALTAVAALMTAIGVVGCTGGSPSERRSRYTPRTREITVTTVPLLVKEARSVYPFLREDFAPGGMLHDKEVYAFVPSTITVVEGDTIRFTFLNPEDDVHSFVLPDLAIALPGQRTTQATYVAAHAGIFPFRCSVPTHLPMMAGELIVLPAATMAEAISTSSGRATNGP
jgi:plastocyanin